MKKDLNRAQVDSTQKTTTKQANTKRLERENAQLKKELDEHLARLNFVPKSVAVHWGAIESQWLADTLKGGPGAKLLLLLQNAERFFTYQAVHALSVTEREEARVRSMGFGEVLKLLRQYGRVTPSNDVDTPSTLVRAPDQISEAELEERINEMAQGRRTSFAPVAG